eukprot:TRINITY_DN2562_c0_g1_i3.p1 TRINITY_DN2562_c0_g1~~TRINITY_DN2562_c0_g1_i3.p1  ORF type:complete len:430 (-),score=66.96 TRINITY_DN2562_c0_g1_i3:114-1403(-)
MNAGSAKLDDLPGDELFAIASLLPLADKLSFRCSCKSFRKIIDDRNFCHSVIVWTGPKASGYLDPNELYRTIINNSHLKQLYELRNIILESTLLQALPSTIRKLKVDHCRDLHCLKYLPTELEALIFKKIEKSLYGVYYALKLIRGSTGHSLRKLKIPNSSQPTHDLSLLSTNLESLTLCIDDDADVWLLPSKLQKLTILLKDRDADFKGPSFLTLALHDQWKKKKIFVSANAKIPISKRGRFVVHDGQIKNKSALDVPNLEEVKVVIGTSLNFSETAEQLPLTVKKIDLGFSICSEKVLQRLTALTDLTCCRMDEKTAIKYSALSTLRKLRINEHCGNTLNTEYPPNLTALHLNLVIFDGSEKGLISTLPTTLRRLTLENSIRFRNEHFVGPEVVLPPKLQLIDFRKCGRESLNVDNLKNALREQGNY